MHIRRGIEGETHCSLREEARGLNISIGNEETQSNGNRERIESVELMETMRNLRMEMQICRVHNERLIRARERKNELNDQLVQSLNQFQGRGRGNQV